jgi:hypothetical protein
MNYYKKILKFFLFITPLLFCFGLTFVFSEDIGIFNTGVPGSTRNMYYEGVGIFISVFSLLFFLLAGILSIRLKKYPVYLSWRNFALLYIPLSLLIVLTSSDTPHGNGGFSYSSDREFGTFAFPFLFVVISLILIVYKSTKLRGK